MRRDLIFHFIAGAIISFLLGLIHPLFGFLVAVCAGIGKEIYDLYQGRFFAPIDVVFTWFGASLGMIINFLI